MKNHSVFYTRSAAILGMLDVLLVPVYFGHLSNQQVTSELEKGSHLNLWKFWTLAMSFHLIHSAILYFLPDRGRKDVWWAMFLGTIGFCGGVYLGAITQNEYFGVMSQFGLLTLILAWGVLAFGKPSKSE